MLNAPQKVGLTLKFWEYMFWSSTKESVPMAMNRVIVLSTIGAQAGTGGCLVQGGGSQGAREDISQISTQNNINYIN